LLSGKKGENWGQHFMQLAAAQDAKKRQKMQEEMWQEEMGLKKEDRSMRQQQIAAQQEQQRRQQEQESQRQQALAQMFQNDPRMQQLAQLDPKMALERSFPKPQMQFAPNGQAVDMSQLQPGQNFAKTPDWKDPEYVATQKAIRAAGAPSVTTNVMPPREVFKDSLALKKDFDGLPEVKGFKEVQGAWDQISTALNNPSPANDLAAATKFMKLLDPGSVVRESELMMAMKASGALDRMANYHNRLIKGEKLTPDQRADFYKSGEALYNAAGNRFGETVRQYEGIAQQYGLDTQFIPKRKEQPSQGKTITMGGKKVEAKQAPDGNDYVKSGDKWYRVEDR
jgi:hypothetical protein